MIYKYTIERIIDNSGLDNILPLDCVIEDFKTDYVVRPSITYGPLTDFSNVRHIQNSVYFTLQIFKKVNSNTDIEQLAKTARTLLIDNVYIYDNKKAIIREINLLKSYQTNFSSISIQILADIV